MSADWVRRVINQAAATVWMSVPRAEIRLAIQTVKKTPDRKGAKVGG